MVLFFCYGTAGASPRPTNLSQIRHRQYGVSVNDVGVDVGIGRTLLSARILEYTCQILYTCPTIPPTLAAICTILLMIYQSIGFFYKNQRFRLTKR